MVTKKAHLRKGTIVILVMIYILSGCAIITKLTTPKYAGKWSYELNTPQGNYKGFMTINKEGKIYTGSISADNESSELENLKIENDTLSASFAAEGYYFDMNGVFEGDVFTGSLDMPDFSMPFIANRVKE